MYTINNYKFLFMDAHEVAPIPTRSVACIALVLSSRLHRHLPHGCSKCGCHPVVVRCIILGTMLEVGGNVGDP